MPRKKSEKTVAEQQAEAEELALLLACDSIDINAESSWKKWANSKDSYLLTLRKALSNRTLSVGPDDIGGSLIIAYRRPSLETLTSTLKKIFSLARIEKEYPARADRLRGEWEQTIEEMVERLFTSRMRTGEKGYVDVLLERFREAKEDAMIMTVIAPLHEMLYGKPYTPQDRTVYTEDLQQVGNDEIPKYKRTTLKVEMHGGRVVRTPKLPKGRKPDAALFWDGLRKAKQKVLSEQKKPTAAYIAEAWNISVRELTNKCKRYCPSQNGQHFRAAMKRLEKEELNSGQFDSRN